MAGVDPDDAADELYGLPPSGFIPARDALVKQARAQGERDVAAVVAALRKPTAAAWLLNALVRHRGDDVDRLLDLGAAMRDAQAALAGEQLRALTVQRQQVVAAMARQSRALAAELGHPVSEAVADEVGETLRAALADPAAAEAVRTGRLTGSLSYAGMGEVDLAGVVALAPRRRLREAALQRPATDQPDHRAPSENEAERRERERRIREDRQRHQREVAQARGQLADARARADAAQEARDVGAAAFEAARERHEQARGAVRELESQLQAAQTELARAGEAVTPARRARDAAARAAASADTAVRAARDRLTALERTAPE